MRGDKKIRRSPFGYQEVYEKLADSISGRETAHTLFFGVYVLLALNGSLIWMLWAGNQMESATVVDWLNWVIVPIVVCAGNAIIFGWFFSILSILMDKKKAIEKTVPQLLISADVPSDERFGLNHGELDKLKRIAEIEQASADWRGIFLTSVIIAVIFSGLKLGNNAVVSYINGFGDFVNRINASSNTPNSYGWYSELVATIVFFIFFSIPTGLWAGAAYFGIRLFDYVTKFLGLERANRVILLACEEAKDFLNKLEAKEPLTIEQKQLIATQCDCMIVPTNTIRQYRYRKKQHFFDGSGEYFLLFGAKLRQTKSPKPAWLRPWLKKSVNKLSKQLSLLRQKSKK